MSGSANTLARVEGRPGLDGLSIEQRDAVMRDYLSTQAASIAAAAHVIPYGSVHRVRLRRAPVQAA